MKSNTEWLTWGKTDPLWGVATCEGRPRSDATPWPDAEFLALGASDWQGYLWHWEHYGVDCRACVEIGCGAGRMTRQLASYFGTVQAVDVSPDMVAYAQRMGALNVTFHLTNSSRLPLPDGSVTAAFSSLVFRHFDRVEHGAVYFAEVHRVMMPGSTLMIELPVHVWPSPNALFPQVLRAEKLLGNLRAVYRRFWLGRGRGEPFFRRRTYEIGWLLDTLHGLGFDDVEIRLVRLSHDRHWCVLASRR